VHTVRQHGGVFLIDRDGPAESIEEGLRRFFQFVIQDLSSGVSFENGDPSKFEDPLIILDPANGDNNVASRVTTDERDALVTTSQKAWETLSLAQQLPDAEETVQLWKELFGSSFSID